VSLVPLVAVGALWVRSYSVSDELEWVRAATPDESNLIVWEFECANGQVLVGHNSVFRGRVGTVSRLLGPALGLTHNSHDPADTALSSIRGFSRNDLGNGAEIIFPIWVLALLTCLLIAAGWPIFRAACGKGDAGNCRRCGYNLTANVSGICPECGMAVVEKTGVKG
jgi:hypothetical protein